MLRKEYLIKSGIGELYHKCSLEDFKGDQKALEKVKDYIDNLDRAREVGVGLYLWGPNGLGKTLCLCEVIKAALEKKNPRTLRYYTARKTSFSEILTKFTEGWYDKGARDEFHSSTLGVDFLGIDDATKAYIPASNNNLHVAALDHVIRQRVERCKPIIITGNEDPKALSVIFGESIGSLLSGHLKVIKFEGQDYRREFRAASRWEIN